MFILDRAVGDHDVDLVEVADYMARRPFELAAVDEEDQLFRASLLA